MIVFFKKLFADPMKKKIFLIVLVSVLVLAAVVVAILLGGKSNDSDDGSFLEKWQGASATEEETTKAPAITTPAITVQPDSTTETSGSSVAIGGADTTPGYGGLIRP